MKKLALVIFLLQMVLHPALVSAQESVSEDARTDTASNTSQGNDDDDARDTLAEMKQDLADQRAQIDELKARDTTRQEEMESMRSELSEVRAEQEAALAEDFEDGGGSTDRYLSVYGFFDVAFIKWFMDENHPYQYVMQDSSSFVMTNMNLYFASQMTESLSALLELRFTFYPHGDETGVMVTGIPGMEYERTDTTIMDYHSSEEIELGGISIERIHLTYSPVDWINIMVGRYLTPYGIWNIDHGSPVVLTISMPYMQHRQMVPHAQTGLHVFGRFFPSASTFIDYAVTLSNGRGPMETVYDLDENKGVGLRLRMIFKGDNHKIAFGGYGYYGKYTDIEKEIELKPEDENLFWKTYVRDSMSRHEIVASADLLFELYGLRFQSEYARSYRIYDKTRPLTFDDRIFYPAADGYTQYIASGVGQAIYGLVGYELPLEKWIWPVRITPYFMYEYAEFLDTLRFPNMKILTTGINVQPSPYVVLKVEYLHITPIDERMGGVDQSVKAQVAVSF